ncbi:FAD-dependent oxidoreductase [Actinomadura macrotermitis]|uniref:3-(3-hydroxy-phenyl)propionate/3-hydroxycinnamic acid hydroxylase n=1 Tax=Actinomadura macrotermitis TaxID=2585200 RepID=A0A7K0BTZ0_9ACTN|nr:NAD(P)/FAD-dependent oxidoreductase [Actinomadura macrotermitis]MQY04658.1 3-(3-hydroxy-phenyl)propionate/3-hydroxycinnamic acid hydroxylase [Actinomadura macrotermitis]
MTTGYAPQPLDADVVICGSGVAGLAAANALGRLGLDVVLLDKKRRQPPIAKGEVLQPGSLDILQGWDVLRTLEARRAVRIDRLVARRADGAELLAMDFGALGGERSWMLSHHYTTILECLGESLGPTVRWRRGVLVDDVIRDPGGRVAGVRVTEGGATRDIGARLVVAADGMSSRLRRSAGIAAEPVAYGHRLLTFELPCPPPVAGEVSAYVTDRGLVMVYPLPEGATRVYVQVTADEMRGGGADRLRRWTAELVGQVPALGPLASAIPGGLDRRQLLKVWRYVAASLARPGIALIGEAAHSVHPLAAQGMNTAIGDAHALAARLSGIDFGDGAAVDGALRGYEDQRMGRIGDVHAMSHNAARMMTSTSRGGRLLGRRLLSGTARSARLSYLTTYNMSGLGMRRLGPLDRLFQLGVLPDRRAMPSLAPE